MTTDAEQPVLADDASNPVTTLALAPEAKPATTIVLEHQRIALQGLMERQALHDPSTKSYKAIGARVAKLQQRYDNDLSAFQAKQLLRPTKRIEANLKRIVANNLDPRDPATYGVNEFTDISPEDFKTRLGFKTPKERDEPSSNDMWPPKWYKCGFAGDDYIPSGEPPESFDWRAKGAVTPVKDQGHCGSCWAFSATEQIESMWIKKYDRFPFISKLSVQQIVSCDDDGHVSSLSTAVSRLVALMCMVSAHCVQDKGCHGGNTQTAYDYVESAGGMVRTCNTCRRCHTPVF